LFGFIAVKKGIFRLLYAAALFRFPENAAIMEPMKRQKLETNVEIRIAGEADVRLLSVLGTVTFYEAYFEQDSPADMANYLCETFSQEKTLAELKEPNSTYFIMYMDGSAVGYARLLRNSINKEVNGGNPVELKRIYLVERVWGTGLGETLLNHCIDAARTEGFDSIWLGVWEKNERGLGFYQKHGFSRVGTLEFPYG
jgi:GNAT superfamily N-acetyltransferase